MGEEFLAIIKLISGEEILASVCIDETGEESIIVAHTPVTMKMISNGMYVKIKPWMELADDDMFVFRTDKIITMSEVKDQKVIKLYERYVEESNEEDDMTKLLPSSGEVKPDEKMLRTKITNKVIMVTGAGGSIGSELCRQIIKLNPKKLISISYLYDINSSESCPLKLPINEIQEGVIFILENTLNVFLFS